MKIYIFKEITYGVVSETSNVMGYFLAHMQEFLGAWRRLLSSAPGTVSKCRVSY
jgi:hypothetical protein